jgi:hypothetical protein
MRTRAEGSTTSLTNANGVKREFSGCQFASDVRRAANKSLSLRHEHHISA